MRFWAYFAAKIVAAGLILWGVLILVDGLFPAIDTSVPGLESQVSATPKYRDRVVSIVPAPQIQTEEIPPPALARSAKNADPALDPRLLPLQHTGQVLAMNTALMGWFLLCAGALYVIVRDQRYRCRVCLRRLRMPVETGSRGFMLQLGRPRTEYICLYGHGTLKEEETSTSVLDAPVWTPHSDDIWAELVAAGKEDGER
jgi:hypothetical protein